MIHEVGNDHNRAGNSLEDSLSTAPTRIDALRSNAIGPHADRSP